jgi:hypothetical protein
MKPTASFLSPFLSLKKFLGIYPLFLGPQSHVTTGCNPMLTYRHLSRVLGASRLWNFRVQKLLILHSLFLPNVELENPFIVYLRSFREPLLWSFGIQRFLKITH